MTAWESMLSQQLTGKLFEAVTVDAGLYISVPDFNKSLLFLQGLDTRNWVSERNNISVMDSVHL